jgi:hypothetical protein
VKSYFQPELLQQAQAEEAEIAARFALSQWLQHQQIISVPATLPSDWREKRIH